MAHQLALGELEDHYVSVEVEEQQPSMFDMLQGSGMEQMGMNMQDALSNLMPKKKKRRKMTVREARKVLTNEEAGKLIDMDEVGQEAVLRAEEGGIIFIDEIDKIAKNGGLLPQQMYREKAFKEISFRLSKDLPSSRNTAPSKQITCCLSQPGHSIWPNRLI